MKILISAAETSSDIHGAKLLEAIREILPPGTKCEVFGIGGPRLLAAGLKPVVDARKLLVMGFVEILGRLPQIFKAMRQMVRAAEQIRPDIGIFIDYPDFHFRLALRLKKLDFPLVYYIPPKVWVWRKSRVQLLRAYFSKILCIFPHEEKFYQNENLNVSYVGNPLMDELPLTLSKKEARFKLGLLDSDLVVVLMVGSRPAELRYHLELLLQSAYQAALELKMTPVFKASGHLQVLVPFPATVDLEQVKDRISYWIDDEKQKLLKIHVSQGNAHECLVAADAGLIKSGTSTLEAGLLKCPHAIVYRASRTTEWIFKYCIRYPGPVGLVNWVSGWAPGEYLVSEYLAKKATVDSLRKELVSLLLDPKKRDRQKQGFETLLAQMRPSVLGDLGSPSLRAAREIVEMMMQRKPRSLC